MAADIRAVPECLDCGACCHSINPQLVELLGGDLQSVPREFVEDDDSGSHMKMAQDPKHDCFVCTALGAGNKCRIYDQRPFLCRQFERGSDECLAAIADLKKPAAQRKH
jgi:Fe-S-cluster containining protein